VELDARIVRQRDLRMIEFGMRAAPKSSEIGVLRACFTYHFVVE